MGLEYAVLLRQYGRVQAVCSELAATQHARIVRLEADIMKLRAQLLIRDTALACAHDDMAQLRAAIPGLPKRLNLVRRVASLSERIDVLMGERMAQAMQARRAAGRMPANLHAKSVLCVGHDRGSVDAAQRAVESAGGHFLHLAGADGEDQAALDASLAAADLVICQTGCVSHGAYWRVHEHCKRTGKQCVLVDQPQAMHFVRSIGQPAPPLPAQLPETVPETVPD